MQFTIIVKDVSFELPNGRLLFENLNFSLERKITALIGPNGVGKTCLARLIAGELEPTQGHIRRNGPLSFFRQKQGPESISVNDFLFNYTWSELGERLLAGIDRANFCSHLSGGQWMRVRLAQIMNDQFLILDEPTNDLDHDGRKALIQFLRSYKHGVLLISHDRECLELCENILELSNQGLTKYGSGWASYEEISAQEREKLQSNFDRAKRERDAAQTAQVTQRERQEKRNRRGSAAAEKGGVPKILLGRRKENAQATSGKINAQGLAKAQEKLREAYEAFHEIKIDSVMYADLIGQELPVQKIIAEAKNFNIKFQNWIYPQDLNFSWRGNIRIALKGSNGSGKSTLIKAILGQMFETRGELRLGQMKTLYVDQRCAQLDDTKSILENVQSVSMLKENEIRNGLAKLLFFGEKVFQKVSSLSGGERLRGALALGLLSKEKPELLILDEPTNNLDLPNIRFIENLLREFKGALLIVSHDKVFLQNCGVNEEYDTSSRRE